ncbi:MAG: MucBP domain-containing protein [Clostridia bacterium]|nr:MucBP domain-containing protein [Clostridia bacterium]
MKKSRIIALLTAAVMIVSVIPAAAAGYFVDGEGFVYDKSGENLIVNPGFEDGLTGLTTNEEYYEISTAEAHSGTNSLKAIKSTKGDGAILKTFAVDNAEASYYLSFWYKNVDTVARRPRVTFAFADSSGAVIDSLVEETNGWVQAGTASNDQDMLYSKGEWVQYTTVLKGNGSNVIKNVVLEVYGLTKNVAYVDDFELYELIPSNEYSADFQAAVKAWEKVSMPKGSLEGFGTIALPRETGVEGIGVQWTSSSVAIDAETGAYSAQPEEELVILTARLYAEADEDVYYEYEYPYIVKSMFTPYIEWMKNDVFPKLGTSVDSDIKLVKEHTITGYYPATITWECSDPAVLDGDGNFTAPETTESVNLIATIECNGFTTSVTKRMKAIGGNIVADGLVMYYDFEKALGKGGVLYDNSQNAKAFNAEVEGITLVDGFAKFAGGESAIILPSDYATALTDSYSVSMWVNVDKTIATNSAMYRFFDFGGGTMTSQFLRYIPGSGQLTFMDRGTADGANDWAIDTTVTGFAQTWKLVTLTYDLSSSPATATVYVDGVAVANSGSYSKLTNSVNSLAGSYSETGFIGRTQWNNGDNPDFIGLMDDVRIYNRAITADEVATLYNETRPTVTAPVTIKFQDIDGETLKEDVIVSADVDTTYDVPASYKSLPSTSDDQYRYVYKYIFSKSTDSITVSADSENVCVLVFQLEKQAMGTNMLANPGFEEGVDGWTSNNGGSLATITGWVRTTEVAHEGNYSLKRNADVGSANASNFGTYIPIETGKVYNLSFWEYCDSAVGAGSSMMSAVCVTSSKGATNNSSDHLLQFGGYSSWVNDANKTSPRDVAYGQGWNQRVFTFDTTGATNANYIFIAYAWSAGSVFCVDDFVLEEAGTGPAPDKDRIDVTVKYVDAEGNTLKDDVIIKIPQGTNSYTIPDNYKTIEDKVAGSLVYKYSYNAKATDGKDVVEISILHENVATLVFDVIKADKNSNLVVDGDFMGEDGTFSWGTWQSPETGNNFATTCQDWFYQVNRDTNASALYLTGLTADDYAVGTRWNDGVTGLCSMANFIEVEKGKTYIVSYDYKHSAAGTDASYISTSFQKTKSYSQGASGQNIPKNVSTEWQTNTFTITAPDDGYIYFHFSWLGSGGSAASSNNGSGPYWYFDNFEVLEVITFENNIKYAAGYAEILAKDGTEGYLVQATYDAEGALTKVVISEKLTLNQKEATKVEVEAGTKLMLVKDLVSLEPLAPAIIAE